MSDVLIIGSTKDEARLRPIADRLSALQIAVSRPTGRDDLDADWDPTVALRDARAA